MYIFKFLSSGPSPMSRPLLITCITCPVSRCICPEYNDTCPISLHLLTPVSSLVPVQFSSQHMLFCFKVCSWNLVTYVPLLVLLLASYVLLYPSGFLTPWISLVSLAEVTSIWRKYPMPIVCLEIWERAKSKGVPLFCCYLPLCSPLCLCELFSGKDLKWPVKSACSPDSPPFFCTVSGHLNIHNVGCHEWTKIWYQEYSP